MSTGASDQAQLRAKGIQSYGIGPASTESDELNYPAHGDVERLAESSLYPFVRHAWNVVTEVAAHNSGRNYELPTPNQRAALGSLPAGSPISFSDS